MNRNVYYGIGQRFMLDIDHYKQPWTVIAHCNASIILQCKSEPTGQFLCVGIEGFIKDHRAGIVRPAPAPPVGTITDDDMAELCQQAGIGYTPKRFEY